MRGLPDDVYRFLLAHIDSVEQLEVLLLLHRSPETDWTPDVVARCLYSHPSSVGRRLAILHAQGLLTAGDQPAPSYRYQPKTPLLDETVGRLADAYRERRVAVITVIASKPMENVRAFSDAFRIRKRDREE